MLALSKVGGNEWRGKWAGGTGGSKNASVKLWS